MSVEQDTQALAALIGEIRQLAEMVGGLPRPGEMPPSIAEDLAIISTQANNALAAIGRLEDLAPLGAGADLDTLLHRMNNYFTGIASLAMLCRDDVRGAPALHARLVDVEQLARRAADYVRQLARARD